jgi:phage terminase large subunit-like protein
MEADANLRLMIIQRRLAHGNDSVLNDHIRVANAKVNTGEENKLRLTKRNPGSKIDAAVALSMAVSRCLYLVLHNPR